MLKFLNDITPEDLEEIKRLAGMFYTPREISVVTEADPFVFIEACEEEGTPVWQAFQAGRLLCETELRMSIIKLAKAGSSPAQTMALQMLRDSKIKMLDR